MAAPGPHRDAQVQEILAEAAADEAHCEEVRGQPEILIVDAADLEAMEVEPEEVQAVAEVPRRLKGKRKPPPAWQTYAPYNAPKPAPEPEAPPEPVMKRPAKKRWSNEVRV